METPITEPVEFPTYLHALRTWMLQYVPDADIEQVDAPTALAGLTTLRQRRQTDVTVIASHTRQGADRLIVGRWLMAWSWRAPRSCSSSPHSPTCRWP